MNLNCLRVVPPSRGRGGVITTTAKHSEEPLYFSATCEIVLLAKQVWKCSWFIYKQRVFCLLRDVLVFIGSYAILCS